MTPQIEAEHLRRRAKKAASYIRNPHNLKVCDQCGSLSKKSAGHCPICKAYRWTETPEMVRAVSRIIGVTPFPLTAGTVPRLTGNELLSTFGGYGPSN